MCIDFCRLNALQPAVVKVNSKAKGNLTLHTLPKIDELYAKLNGAKHFSALDLTRGYYHIELGETSRTFSKTEEEHLQHLEIIFQRLCEAGLKLKWSKCSFMKLHIEYLGHLISESGTEPMPDKSAIKKMPAPRSPKEIKQFLGLIGYYRKFIPRFSDVAKPLTRLTRHDTLFQ